MPQHETEHDDSTTMGSTDPGALVLLAEPDAERRVAFTETLSQAGYEVRSITEVSGVAFEAARVTPALIIARVADPITEGFSVCRALRAARETRDIPLLILTRLDDVYTREHILRAGATAILVEPLRRTLFLRQVRRLLARGARTGQSRSTSWSAGAFTVSRAAS